MTADKVEFGPVIVVKGKHKGRVGLYDDDDIGPIVYLFRGDGYVILGDLSYIEEFPIPEEEDQTWFWEQTMGYSIRSGNKG